VGVSDGYVGKAVEVAWINGILISDIFDRNNKPIAKTAAGANIPMINPRLRYLIFDKNSSHE
jgi:hypothetical protein